MPPTQSGPEYSPEEIAAQKRATEASIEAQRQAEAARNEALAKAALERMTHKGKPQ